MRSNPIIMSGGHKASVVLALLLGISGCARAAFIGPYALTPPAEGSYSPVDGATFGGWTATVYPWPSPPPDTYREVYTAGAPDTLYLSVGDLAPGGASTFLWLTTVIVDDGILSFDFSAGYGGGGTNNVAFLIDYVPVAIHPISGSFSYPVFAGQHFTFDLSAYYDGSYASQVALTVSNFNVPEPSAAWLCCGSTLLLVRRRR